MVGKTTQAEHKQKPTESCTYIGPIEHVTCPSFAREAVSAIKVETLECAIASHRQHQVVVASGSFFDMDRDLAARLEESGTAIHQLPISPCGQWQGTHQLVVNVLSTRVYQFKPSPLWYSVAGVVRIRSVPLQEAHAITRRLFRLSEVLQCRDSRATGYRRSLPHRGGSLQRSGKYLLGYVDNPIDAFTGEGVGDGLRRSGPCVG